MKFKQFIKLALVGSMAAATVGALAACQSNDGGKAPEGYTGFIEGCSQEVQLGASLDLLEFVDFVQWDDYYEAWATGLLDFSYEHADYTLTLSNEDDTHDLTGMPYWDVSVFEVEPGDYTLTYTINEKDCAYNGTYTMPLAVVVPDLAVSFTATEEATTYYFNDQKAIRSIMAGLTLTVESYYDYEETFSKAVVNGVEKPITGSTYTFDEVGKHVLTLYIEDTAGRTFQADITFTVIYNSVYEDALFLKEDATGAYKIPLDHIVSNVAVNGTPVTNAVIDETGVTIDKSILAANPGECVVSFVTEAGETEAAYLKVVPANINFNDGANIAIASFGRYSANGLDGELAMVENFLKEDGNYSVQGIAKGDITNLMNVNFDTAFLAAIFGGESHADYFTFDMYSDVPYLRFVREGGGYKADGATDYTHKNTYLIADADDVGFGEYADTHTHNGKTLYRHSIIYRREAWLAISNNGTAKPEDVVSTVAFDWSSSIDFKGAFINTTTGMKEEKFVQGTKNISVFFIDNIRINNANADNLDFEDGNTSGNFIVTKVGSTGGATSVVKMSEDNYALKHVTTTDTRASANATAFGLQMGWLHQVFNVAGADALTFKFYVENADIHETMSEYTGNEEPFKVDFMLQTVNSSGRAARTSKSFKVEKQAPVGEDDPYTVYLVTITKEYYHTYFNADGTYKANSISGVAELKTLGLGMTLTRYRRPDSTLPPEEVQWGYYSIGKGTCVYFDDFTKVMPQSAD